MSKKIIANDYKELENGEMEVTITFNPFEHGHFLGPPRNYNKEKYREMVENKKTQIHIKNGYAVGYYGHDSRDPNKGYIPNERDKNGDVIYPCCKTLSMEWLDNGLVKHTQRILNNEIGQEVQKLIRAGVGGFSSAHNLKTGGFYGFDYVISPNFTTNRVIVDNTCKNGMCGINIDSVFSGIDNELKANISFYLDSIGIDDNSLLETIYNLEKHTLTYQDNIRLLNEIENQKKEIYTQLDNVEHSKNRIQNEFQNFIENKYKKLVIQLDSLGFVIDNNDEIKPTENTLKGLFKPTNFDSILENQYKATEFIKSIREPLKKEVKAQTKLNIKNPFGL